MKPHGLILHRNSAERLSWIVRSFTAGRKVACGSLNTKPRERQYAFRSRSLIRGTSMTNEHYTVSTDSIDRELLGSASRNGRNRWPRDIYSTDSDSGRCCERDAFRMDARTGRCIRQVVHRELARPPEMEWIARRVRISL